MYRFRILMMVVLFSPLSAAADGVTRTYYIAAEEIIWDYTPSWPMNPITGEAFNEAQNVFLEDAGRKRIGHRYRKAVYREYTDETFTTRKPRSSRWRHLGVLGPVIRAIVGDTIKVVFKNKLENKAVSIHPHGLRYAKDSEGAAYDDGTAGADKRDERIEPGESHTYTWTVPPRAGPGPADPGSVAWLYYSNVDKAADINAGLVGPIIISRRFQARQDTAPADAHREFVTLFMVFDENESFLADRNRDTLAPEADPLDDGFRRSNRMHAINGYMYDNLPGMSMRAGRLVRWHVLSPGLSGDLHAPHWHGNNVTAYGSFTDTVNLMPSDAKSVTMETDNPGTWLYHCHVDDHAAEGMTSVFTVTPP